jgi:hypothetical protein
MKWIVGKWIVGCLVATLLVGCEEEKSDANQPPIIQGTPPSSVTVNERYSFIPTATDANGDTLTFSITNPPSWSNFDTATGELSGVPGSSEVGDYNNIVISVSDGTDSAAIQAFTISVTGSAGSNNPPNISGSPITSIQVGESYRFTPTSTDNDGDKLTFSISNPASWSNFDTATGELTGVPGSSDVGDYNNIVISVSDGMVSTTLSAFAISVTESGNHPPAIDGSPASSVDVNGSYSFTPSASDDDDDTLTFSITNRPYWSSFDTTTGDLSGMPDDGDIGDYQNIVISVSDGSDSVSLPAFTISVLSGTDGGLPRATLSDFSYRGAFKMDHETQYGDSHARYASAVFEVSNDATSFFFGGKGHDTSLGQFLFPQLSSSYNPDDLNIAPVLQDFSSFIGKNTDTPEYEGIRIPTGNPQLNDRITGLALVNNMLVANVVKYYDADARNTHTTMLISNPSDLANSQVYGFFSLEGQAHAAGWISEIPAQWQSELGGDYITGWASGLPIASRNSIGPSAFVMDMDNISTSTSTVDQVPATALMDFSTANELHADAYNNQETEQRNNQNQDTLPIIVGTNDLWTVLSWAVYGFIIPDTRTYAVFGSSGGHDTGIGYKIQQVDASSNCPGPCANNRNDYYNYYWLFDVNDLVAVKKGQMLPHEVRPYEYGKFPAPFQDQANILSSKPEAYRPIRGGDYDAANKVLYLVLGGSSQPEQIIVAYDVSSVTDGGGGSSTEGLTVSAGVDQLNVPSDSQVTLNGAVQTDGQVTSLRWEQVSGTARTSLTNSESLGPSFVAPWLNPDNNELTFRLYATDSLGNEGSDEVVVSIVNSTPKADAGVDQVILGGDQVELNASHSLSRSGDSISNLQWEQIEGTAVDLSSTTNAVASFISPMVTGQEVLRFRVTVVDDDGSSDYGEVTITVVDQFAFQDFGGRFYGVFLDANKDIAYIAQGEGGLGIYDLSDPSRPLLIGTYNTDGSAQDVQVRGNYAYIADKYLGLKIIDISSPALPVLVGSIDTPGIATKLALYGDYVYMADYGRGLLAIDVSNPASPTIKHDYDTDGRALGVTISADGNTAYVADRSALLVFDISDKGVAPVLQHNIVTERDAYSITIHGNMAYLANGETGLLVFDISNPSVAPVLLETIDTPGLAKDVLIDGDVLLLADGTSGLAYYDISNPMSPQLVSQIDTIGDSEDLAVLADDVLVADGYGGLQVIDISTPANPTPKGHVVTVGSGSALVIDPSSETAYVADYYNGLVVMDISNPLAPRVKGHFPIDADGYRRGCFDLVIDEHYAYIANGFHGLRIIDISNTNQLQQVSLTPLTERSRPGRGVDKQGQYVYLAADDGGIVVIDALDPANPFVVGANRFEIDGSPYAQAKDVIVHKDHAILANGWASFAISDISDPTNPLNTATLLTDEFELGKGDGHGIAVWRDYALLGHFGGGLEVIDISTPTSPVITSEVGGGLRSISNVFVNGDYLYASDSANQSQVSKYHSLLIWELTESGFLPELADGTYALGGRYPAMDVLGNYMFLAGEGFKVLDISNRLSPHQ